MIFFFTQLHNKQRNQTKMDGQLVLVTTPNSITLQNMKNVLNLFNTRML